MHIYLCARLRDPLRRRDGKTLRRKSVERATLVEAGEDFPSALAGRRLVSPTSHAVRVRTSRHLCGADSDRVTSRHTEHCRWFTPEGREFNVKVKPESESQETFIKAKLSQLHVSCRSARLNCKRGRPLSRQLHTRVESTLSGSPRSTCRAVIYAVHGGKKSSVHNETGTDDRTSVTPEATVTTVRSKLDFQNQPRAYPYGNCGLLCENFVQPVAHMKNQSPFV